MAKRRILFVDDELNVLEGLRNLLRKQRHQWDMVFATSGRAALEELAKAPADVIVSDMRMPEMDGAALLAQVKQLYPQTARIVLSGHAEREAISRVISVAHQFLSKPSDADTVRSVIERTCSFQSLMEDEGMRRVVGTMEQLPSVPETYWALTRATEDPRIGIGDIARIVERDPAMSVKVLQLVNSAYFGLAQRTESISAAVTYLGVENLKGLLLAANVFRADGPSVPGFSIDRLREEALLVANLARAMTKDRATAEAAFTAGLVHDVGRLLLARAKPELYRVVVEEVRGAALPVRVVEKRTLGVAHGAAGAYLLGVWGLPFALAECVAFHDTPSEVRDGPRDVLAAVHLSDALIGALLEGRDPVATGELDLAFVESMGLTAQLPVWRERAEEAVQRAAKGTR